MEKMILLEPERVRVVPEARRAVQKKASFPERQHFSFYRLPIRPRIFYRRFRGWSQIMKILIHFATDHLARRSRHQTGIGFYRSRRGHGGTDLSADYADKRGWAAA